jgi:hypothetical protein
MDSREEITKFLQSAASLIVQAQTAPELGLMMDLLDDAHADLHKASNMAERIMDSEQ